MTIPELFMRRLTVARYLFQMGIEQCHRGEPFGALAISPLHDAAELFLLVGLEHCEATLPKQKNDFFANWEAIEQRTQKKLSWRPEMDRFNKARVELKHCGLLPAQSAVEEFRHIVESFFEENTPVLFGLEAAKAFRRALQEYRYGRLAEGTFDRLYEPAADLSFSLSSALRHDFNPISDSSRVKQTLQRVVNGLGEAITVVAYNLDFDSYRYLKHFGPVVHEIPGGDVFAEWTTMPTTNIQIASRCVDFAINAALRLQSKQAVAI